MCLQDCNCRLLYITLYIYSFASEIIELDDKPLSSGCLLLSLKVGSLHIRLARRCEYCHPLSNFVQNDLASDTQTLE